MDRTALDELLERAQDGPVFIEKEGRRHSVLMSLERYEAMVGSLAPADGEPPLSPAAQRFYEQHKEWVDEQNAHVRKHGIWNEEFRGW